METKKKLKEVINNLEQQCIICNKDQENEKLKELVKDMEQEQIAEMKEHQEAMLVADKRIKALKAGYEKMGNLIKIAFYHEFDELIPSIMADKIDEIVKEVLREI